VLFTRFTKPGAAVAAVMVQFLLAALPAYSQAIAHSDWIDDDRSVFQASVNHPPAESQVRRPGSPGVLTGSASAYGSIPGRSLNPLSAGTEQLNLGADADRFISGATTDQVVPPSTFSAWLRRTHPEFNLSAQNDPDAVVEVKGAWDNSAQVLDALGIRYHHVKAKELRDINLNQVKVIVINCEGKIPQDMWEPIRQWVSRGGYIISTDWTLHNFVEQAFPGYIAWNGGKSSGTLVDAMVVSVDPVLFAGVPVKRCVWKLDEGSEMVKVLRPDVVHVLARSYKLGLDDPARNSTYPGLVGVLAVEFSHGRGRVLHLVGHFDYNAPPFAFRRNLLQDAMPVAGIGLRQAIATNFLVEGLQKTGTERERSMSRPDRWH
jgi:hypothetical protein